MGLMSWWKNWRNQRQFKALNENFDGFFDSLIKAGSASGVDVTWETALQCSVSFACARVISEGMAQIPFRLMQQVEDRRNPATGHYKYDLLNTNPNDLNTSFEFFETMGLHLSFCGNFFGYKVFQRGQLAAIMPWNPKCVKVDSSTGFPEYKLQKIDGTWMDVPRKYIWHVKGPSWDNVIGLDAVKLAREAIGLGLATEKHGAKLFSNGATVGGILSTDQDLPAEKRDELRKSWQSRQAGGDNAWKTAVLWSGLKWLPQGFKNDESQFLETRQHQIEEICRFFRVMPIMIGYSDKASTYASAEQMFLAHVVHTMGPWYRRIEKSADKFLLTSQERNGGFYTKFMPQALLRGSHKERSEFYRTMVEIKAMNPNEVRALEEMNPYKGGEAYENPNITPGEGTGNEDTE